MYESTEGPARDRSTTRIAVSPVDEALATLLDELFSSPRVTYAPVMERPTYWAGHGGAVQRLPHRRFVLRAGVDLDDPR